MKGNRRKSMKAVGLEPTTYGLKVCLEGFFARSKYYDEPRNSSESPGFLLVGIRAEKSRRNPGYGGTMEGQRRDSSAAAPKNRSE